MVNFTDLNYLDANLNTTNSSKYLFCDDDSTMIYGCQDITACNYDSLANYSNTFFYNPQGPCVYAEEYYDCDNNCLLDSDDDGICDEQEVPGCTDDLACNFDYTADNDDGSCIYAIEYYDCDGNCLNDFDLDGDCDEVDNDDGIGIEEITDDTRALIKMIDVLGREQKEHKKGTLLFYIYDNGLVEKKYLLR